MNTSPSSIPPRGLPKAVLFDLDGTLVDTAPDLGHAANLVRESLQLEPLPLEGYRPVASAGARGLLGKALGITPADEDFPKHRDRFLELYRANLSRQSRLFDGMEQMLRLMEDRGIRWGVVTNKPAWLTGPLMEDLALAQRAAVSISGDQVPKPKPAPDSLLKACEMLGLDPADCIYVGDDRRDIEAGRAAGMRTMAAAWGYEGEHAIHSWQADSIVQTPADLRSWLD